MEAITVIIPIFNEEGNILRLWSEVQEYRKNSRFEITALFVNDGSTDNSLSLIKEVCLINDGFGYISFASNNGLSAAIKAGVDYSNTKWVGYLDGDLQTTPMDFLKFEPFLSSFDLVTGERQDRKDGFGKKLSSNFANGVRNHFLKDGIKDTGCPLKIFNREFLGGLPYFKGFHRFFPALTQIYGGKIKVIPVQHFPRMEGKSKFNTLNRMVQPMMDLFLVYRLKQRSIIYVVNEIQTFKTKAYHE